MFLQYLGEVYLGEFLNPGYDCTDILNHEEDATDGFYWITLGADTKRKVSSIQYISMNCDFENVHKSNTNGPFNWEPAEYLESLWNLGIYVSM